MPDAAISPGYFQALGIPLLAGREFSADDTAAAPPVILISESVARHHFGDENPLGHFIEDAEPSLTGPWARIVGVVGDARYQGLDGTAEAVYRPVAQSFDPGTQLILRSALPATSLAPLVRRAVASLEPEAVVGPTESLGAIEAESLGPRLFVTELLAGFALLALALALAAIGIYGVIAYSVSRRTHEIGVRVALGARSSQILGHVLGQGLRLAALGAALGLGGALLITRALTGLLYRTSPHDPATLALVTVGLVGVALTASFLPAWRAARVAPLDALRQSGE